MNEHINRNNLIARIERHYRRIEDEIYQLSEEDKIFNWALDVAMDIVNNEPAADVEEVVRCKDCKYWNQECCARFGWLDGKSTEEDWYCPNGERRIEDG